MTWQRAVLAAASAIGLLVTGAAVPATSESPTRDLVHTDRGPVRGAVDAGSRTFQGIPYAAPPLDELRWRSPRPAPRWHEPLDATAPRDDCAQTPHFAWPASDSEDCLYLNVTTPRRAHGRLPVVVWLHAGGYTNGGGAHHDARKLAVEGDVVVVTVNYRLGALGFLAHPALNKENPGVQSGNYGLEDQRAALRWVRRNAAAFGGDPGNVTLAGASSGSGSVCAHLVSPAAAGLFHRAILQSFACVAPPMTPQQDAERAGADFVAGLGCTEPAQVAACLRSKPVGELVRAWPGGFPVIGGREFPLAPPEALRTDRFHHVPLLLGSTKDEMRLFVGQQWDGAGQPVTAARYEEMVRTSYGEEVLRRYPVSAYPSPSIALATVQTDAPGLLSTCSHLAGYRLFAARPHPVPVYAYQFADRTAPGLFDVPGFDEGAMHGAELNFLFPGYFGGPLSYQQQALSTTLVRYWANFAHHGSPNGRNLPTWPRFRSSADVLSLDLGPGGITPVDIGTASNCDLW